MFVRDFVKVDYRAKKSKGSSLWIDKRQDQASAFFELSITIASTSKDHSTKFINKVPHRKKRI